MGKWANGQMGKWGITPLPFLKGSMGKRKTMPFAFCPLPFAPALAAYAHMPICPYARAAG
jgi:hypothetical protein